MKKLIEKFIHKLLFWNESQKRFLFARLLAECIKDDKKTEDVICRLASYFVHYNKSVVIPFNDIFVVGDTVYIFTERPGYWIGKEGSTVNAIEHQLNYNLKEEKIGDYHIRFIEEKYTTNISIKTYIRIMNQY